VNRWKTTWAALAAIGMALSGAQAASAGKDESSLHDLITVLKERGVIDEGDYESIAAKNAAWEQQQAESRKPTLSFWGDFRGRYEGIIYDEDETGSERTNRHRGRYRLRLNGKADINDRAKVLFRVTSGADDPRSANQTLGSAVDFDTDDFRLDMAYVHLSPFPNGRLGENGTLVLEFGKVPNAFKWKRGKDFMLWDNDITLEGVTLRSSWRFSETFETFLTGGYYIIDENSRDKDPHMVAIQAGFHADPAESISLGGRASYYRFESLDPAFHLRGEDGTGGVTTAGGNIRDGLSGGFGGQDVHVVEAAAYLALLTDTDWPVLLYGTWANNLTAESSVSFPGADEEDAAWGGGVEIGDKNKYVKLGVGYWHVEANAFPAQFIDSNLFDGVTNREGWAVYGSRSILKNTDLNLTVFVSDEIESSVPPFGDSVPDADRVRLQADVVFSFK